VRDLQQERPVLVGLDELQRLLGEKLSRAIIAPAAGEPAAETYATPVAAFWCSGSVRFSSPLATLYDASLTSALAARMFARAMSSTKTKSMVWAPSPKIIGGSPE
jgi:hypothetical protein